MNPILIKFRLMTEIVQYGSKVNWPDGFSKTCTSEESMWYELGRIDGLKCAIDLIEKMERE